MRYSPLDDCSERFTDCPHNRSQTHYHCIQDGCDKVSDQKYSFLLFNWQNWQGGMLSGNLCTSQLQTNRSRPPGCSLWKIPSIHTYFCCQGVMLAIVCSGMPVKLQTLDSSSMPEGSGRNAIPSHVLGEKNKTDITFFIGLHLNLRRANARELPSQGLGYPPGRFPTLQGHGELCRSSLHLRWTENNPLPLSKTGVYLYFQE